MNNFIMKNKQDKRVGNIRGLKRTLLATACALLLGASAQAAELERPNILWITGEDMSASWLACYGNENIETPNFDKFADEGFLYTNCFAQSPVCAAARSGWMMGMHPTSIGTVYMRSKNKLPESLVWYADALRANGYFAANSSKTDYNTVNRYAGRGGGKKEGTVGHFVDTWDSFEPYAWRNPERKPDQPFFQVINAVGGHEGVLHRAKGKPEIADPADMKLAAYHPDIPEMRVQYADYSEVVMKADSRLKKILDDLEKDGLAEDTIVVYTSDHGGAVGRSKRFLYDSGTHAAHIVRIPEKYKHLRPAEVPGTRIDELVSFLDITKTWLAITNSEIPPEMQGCVYLGPKTEPVRDYVHMARNRMDECPDMQRALRDKRYLYIRNFEPFRPNGQYLEYLWKAPSMKAWHKYHLAGKTDAVTGAFFRPKPVEQLFDCEADPDNVVNLANDPAQAERLVRMREELARKQLELYDCGYLPEGTLMDRAQANKMTIYELIRTPGLYDQQGYMKAADLANFAQEKDLPKLIQLLRSDDEAYRYWGVIGCIGLGKQAATPEVLDLMNGLMQTDLSEVKTLDVRTMAAFYCAQIDKNKAQALRSLKEVENDVPSKLIVTRRAAANLKLLEANY